MNINQARFSKDHEWVCLEGGKAYIGITDFAQNALGDIVFVDMPAVGKILKAGDAIGSIESVKAVSDVYAPISGKILEINGHLDAEPELLNSAPFENWIITVEPSNPQELESLLSAGEYQALCAKEG